MPEEALKNICPDCGMRDGCPFENNNIAKCSDFEKREGKHA